MIKVNKGLMAVACLLSSTQVYAQNPSAPLGNYYHFGDNEPKPEEHIMSEIGMSEAESKAKMIKLKKVASNKKHDNVINKHNSYAQ